MRKIKTEYITETIDKEKIINLINSEFNKDVYGVYIAGDISDIVFWKDGKLLIYNNEINYDLLRELRLFNKEKELYIWKNGNKFKCRIRKDIEEIGDTDILEENYYIWGSSLKVEENWTTLMEERGTKIHIYGEEKIKLPLSYKVINYLEKNDDGTIGVIDSRIAGIYHDNSKVYLGGEK